MIAEVRILRARVLPQCDMRALSHVCRSSFDSQLHTLAAYFPDQPTAEQSTSAISFMRALAMLYPCSHCAAELRDGMQDNPPR